MIALIRKKKKKKKKKKCEHKKCARINEQVSSLLLQSDGEKKTIFNIVRTSEHFLLRTNDF